MSHFIFESFILQKPHTTYFIWLFEKPSASQLVPELSHLHMLLSALHVKRFIDFQFIFYSIGFPFLPSLFLKKNLFEKMSVTLYLKGCV